MGMFQRSPTKQLPDNFCGIHKSLGVTRNRSGHRQITSRALGSYWRTKPSTRPRRGQSRFSLLVRNRPSVPFVLRIGIEGDSTAGI
jgi:hypothetical protein